MCEDAAVAWLWKRRQQVRGHLGLGQPDSPQSLNAPRHTAPPWYSQFPCNVYVCLIAVLCGCREFCVTIVPGFLAPSLPPFQCLVVVHDWTSLRSFKCTHIPLDFTVCFFVFYPALLSRPIFQCHPWEPHVITHFYHSALTCNSCWKSALFFLLLPLSWLCCLKLLYSFVLLYLSVLPVVKGEAPFYSLYAKQPYLNFSSITVAYLPSHL